MSGSAIRLACTMDKQDLAPMNAALSTLDSCVIQRDSNALWRVSSQSGLSRASTSSRTSPSTGLHGLGRQQCASTQESQALTEQDSNC